MTQNIDNQLLLNNNYSQQRLQYLLSKLKNINTKDKECNASNKIAIIGMGCRFANNITSPSEFWQSLTRNENKIINIPNDRHFILNSSLIDDAMKKQLHNYKAAFLNNVYSFDPTFFGISPLETYDIDPQYRLLLEVTWEALEDASIPLKKAQNSKTGIYMGIGTDDYTHLTLQMNNIEQFNNYTLTGSNRGVGIGRISYLFGFDGPSLAIDTTCSSSLVAVHYAIQSLVNKETNLAFAGGVNLILSPYNIIGRKLLGVLSKNGICHVFDARANGFVQGEGAGVILLKRFEDAIKDNDNIYAVIISSAVNQNGGGNGIQSPNGNSQQKLLESVLAKAKLTANDIDYIETHGTGTELGDPIEVEAISKVYGVKRTLDNPILIGSSKAAYGHLEPAAGILSLIKTALCIKNGKLFKQPCFEKPNQHINWAKNNVKVVDKSYSWPANSSFFRAGISSFGINGTNAHLVIEKYTPRRNEQLINLDNLYLLPISAKTIDALDIYIKKYIDYLQETNNSINDICYTAAIGKSNFKYRVCVIGKSKQELISELLEINTHKGYSSKESNQSLLYLFMTNNIPSVVDVKELYEYYEIYREVVERCDVIYKSVKKTDIKKIILHGNSNKFNDGQESQAFSFIHELALYEILKNHGIKPCAIVGHIQGEFLAAYIAGIMELEDAFLSYLDSFQSADKINHSSGKLKVISAPNIPIAFISSDSKLKNIIINKFSTEKDGVYNLEDNISALLSKGNYRVIRFNTVHNFEYVLSESGYKAAIGNEELILNNLHMTLKTISRLYMAGAEINWESVVNTTKYNKVSLPNHPYIKKSYISNKGISMKSTSHHGNANKISIINVLKDNISELAGIESSACDLDTSLISMGMDSFIIIALAQRIKKIWNVSLTIQDLFEEVNTINKLSEYICNNSTIIISSFDQNSDNIMKDSQHNKYFENIKLIICEELNLENKKIKDDERFIEMGANTSKLASIASKLNRIFNIKLGVDDLTNNHDTVNKLYNNVILSLANPGSRNINSDCSKNSTLVEKNISTNSSSNRSFNVAYDIPKFKAVNYDNKNIDKIAICSLNQNQIEYLQKFISRYNIKTKKSKDYAENARGHLCNNRKSSSGFRYETKELNYPIVATSSKGSKIYDLDGNEYVDLSMGFGANLFGHKPEFIFKAINTQLDKGIQIGPESEYASDCAKLVAEFSNKDKVLFTNSGTEAIMTAIRIARAFRKKDKIVVFQNSYHGHADHTLVMTNIEGGIDAEPMCIGIPKSLVNDVIILPYDKVSSIDEIVKMKDSIAAVLVEPVQNRRPDLHPKDFLKKLRIATEQNGITLIFDEILVGFRVLKGGAQEAFEIDADLVTYGKIVGGGLPIGVIAGKRDHMDVVDGGMWNYGDLTEPLKEITYTAGTFCKHPLAMTACYSTLTYIKQYGDKLYEILNTRSTELFKILNNIFDKYSVPLKVYNFGSFFRFSQANNLSFLYQPLELDIFFYHLIEKGVYVWESKTCFISTEHTDDDMDTIIKVVHDTVVDMKQAGFWSSNNDYDPPTKRSFTNIENSPSHSQITDKISYTSSYTNSNAQVLNNNFLAKKDISNIIDFSIYFFGDYKDYQATNPYDLIIEIAKYADENNFKAIWLPERHFNSFGGFSPNPAVISSAIARETTKINLRASVVLPLQHPTRVAEEWAMVQRLSQCKQVGLAFVPGWHTNDFILNPAVWDNRKNVLLDNISIIKELWEGKEYAFIGPNKTITPTEVFPKPFINHLPMWMATIESAEIFEKAGELGIGVITNLLGQDINDLKANIKIYKNARERFGHDPNNGHIVVLIHTFVGKDKDETIGIAKKPFCDYLASSVSLFNKMAKLHNLDVNFEAITKEDRNYIINQAYERFIKGNSLIGSVDTCSVLINRLVEIGVSEVACFIDFGISADEISKNMHYLNKLKNNFFVMRKDLNNDESVIKNYHQQQKAKKLPLSKNQSHMLMVEHFETGGRNVNNLTIAYDIKGNINLKAMNEAYIRLIQHHASLRVIIDEENQIQIYRDTIDLTLEYLDMLSDNNLDAEEKITNYLSNENNKICDLNKSSHQFRLLKISTNRFLLILTIHHVISDGISLEVILRDLSFLYNQLVSGKPCNINDSLQYDEYIERGLSYKNTDEYKEQSKYWSNILKDGLPLLNINHDYTKPDIKTYNGKTINVDINPITKQLVHNFAVSCNCTNFMVMLSAYSVLISKITKQSDVVIGVAFSGRTLPGSEKSIGYYSNMYPIKVNIISSDNFKNVLQAIRFKILEALQNQDIPQSDLMNISRNNINLSHNILFSVAFNWDDVCIPKFNELEVDFYEIEKKYVRNELMLNIIKINERLIASLEYNTDIFKDSTALDIITNYTNMLEILLDKPSSPICEINLHKKMFTQENIEDFVSNSVAKLNAQISNKNNNIPENCGTKICYWVEQLQDATYTSLNSRSYPKSILSKIAFISKKIPDKLATSLVNFSESYKQPIVNVLLASLYGLISRYCNQEDIIIGIHPDITFDFDYIQNMKIYDSKLPLRVMCKNYYNIRELITNIEYLLTKARENKQVDYKNLIQELNIKIDDEKHPFFSIMFMCIKNSQNLDIHNLINNINLLCAHENTLLDLLVIVEIKNPDILINLFYNEKNINKSMAENLCKYYINFINSAVNDPSVKLYDVFYLSKNEMAKLDKINITKKEIPLNKNVPLLFEEIARKYSNNNALLFEDDYLIYSHLNERSNQIAHYLKSNMINSEEIVGVSIPRSFELIIGILGILKAGGVYLPLDPTFPHERLDYMIKDSGIKQILIRKDTSYLFDQYKGNKLYIDSDDIKKFPKINPNVYIHPDALAYVIYTSGSTGLPKGVGRSHKGIINRILWMKEGAGLSNNDICALQASISVIDSGWEIFGALLTGAQLAIYDEIFSKNAHAILHQCYKYKITRFTIVTSLLRELIAIGPNTKDLFDSICVNYWQVTGEPVNTEYLYKLFKLTKNRSRITECYGTTEATSSIFKEYYCNNEILSFKSIVSYNAEIHILDDYLNKLPVGVKGNLYVGGEILARGYINNPTLTAEKFIPNPYFKIGSSLSLRLYCTGDQACYLPDGNIEIIGRKDNQIKIRGFRVELGEIESVIYSINEVKQAVVAVLENEESTKRLVGYVVPSNDNFDKKQIISQIRSICKIKLPDYMQLSQIVILDEMPLTQNGKIDRTSLPIPNAREGLFNYEEPNGEIECYIAKAWSELLKTEKIGRNDNFFELGGDSLLLVQFIAKIIKDFNAPVTMAEIYKKQTIRDLAEYINIKIKLAPPKMSSNDIKTKVDSTLHIESSDIGQVPLTPNRYAYFLLRKRNFEYWHVLSPILQSGRSFNPKFLNKAVDVLITHHDGLRMRLRQCGDSFEQIIVHAHEMNAYNYFQYDEKNEILDFKEFVEKTILHTKNEITFNNDFFKVICIDGGDKYPYIIYFISHHVLLDAYSARIIIHDLFKIYSQISLGQKPNLPSKTTSFKNYSTATLSYLKSIESDEYEYWKNIPWEMIKPIKVDTQENMHLNIEGETHNIIKSINVDDINTFMQAFKGDAKSNISHVLLYSIAKAYKICFGNSVLNLGLLFHGREIFKESLDLSRTVGWLSEVVPIIINADEDINTAIHSIYKQIKRINEKGKSFNYLKFMSQNAGIRKGMAKLPLPEISLNFITPSIEKRNYSNIVKVAPDYGIGMMEKQDTERVYLLSGGAYFSNSKFNISWDYSSKIFKYKTINKFTNLCLTEFSKLAKDLNLKNKEVLVA